ncbi:MAG: hypothetical protein FJW14_16010, partial [Acidimicrobiia bacterium]|nr:hypothetical protein [Acidimicrobiia bacterium]
YMAPEQVRGIAADQRADIFAFGAILYEMLAGARAFQGGSAPETMTAILKQDPPNLSTVYQHIPPTLARIVNRCLEKDPAARFRSISDVAFALEAFGDAGSATDVRAVDHRGRSTRLIRTIAVAVATAMLLGATVLSTRLALGSARSEQLAVSRVELNLPPGAELNIQSAGSVALSPDGTTVVFLGTVSGRRQVYVRRLDQFRGVALAGTETTQTSFFAPDGSSIGFIGPDNVLKKVSLSDGFVVTLTRNADYHVGATWTDDGRIIFGRAGSLWQIPASGGTPEKLTTPDSTKGELLHGWPSAMSGGTVLFASVTGTSLNAARIEALLPTGERRVLVESGTYPLYAPTGHLIFYRDGTLVAAPFDAEELRLTGPAVRAVENVAVASITGMPQVAISASGSLLYPPNDAGTSRLVWVARDGAEQPLNDVPRLYRTPRLTPDQSSLVMEAGGDLWMHDLLRGAFTRLTSENTGGNSFPVISPDGTRVVFRTLTGMQSLPTDGSGQLRPVSGSSAISDIPTSISRDNRLLTFVRQTPDTSGDIYVVPLDSSAAPSIVVSTVGYDGGPQFSPDGRWMAYASDESGRMEVYVRPYPGPDRKLLVSTDGGTHPLWNKNGAELFYRSANKMMAVTVTTGTNITLSTPRVLFDQRYSFASNTTVANYDISSDGQRFVMVKDESDSGRLNLVLNWFEELRRLAPAP